MLHNLFAAAGNNPALLARLFEQVGFIGVLDQVDAAAADAAGLKAATATVVTPVTLTAANLITAGKAALAACPRAVVFTTAGGTAADVPATARITGLTLLGPQVETVTLAQTATTATSTNYFTRIDEIYYPAGDGTGGTVAIGFSANLGLPAKIKGRGASSAVFAFLRELVDGAAPTAGAFIAPASALPFGAYTPNSAANGARDYLVFFEADPVWTGKPQ